jgi:hypothetical protein
VSNKYTHPWKPAEDAVIREDYANKGAHYCAKLLPERTLAAVYRRATLLGFKRTFVGKPPRNAHNKRRPLEVAATVTGPLPSVEAWLAAGNEIERPGPRPFLRIRLTHHRAANPVRWAA